VTGPVLFDTNVISELARPRPEPRVVDFIVAQREPLLSVLTLHELTWGAERVKEPRRRAKLIAWVASMRARFIGRLLHVDADIAEHAGRLRAAAAARGRVVEAVDALLAASALARGALLATRNISDFEPTGVPLVDPWVAR
jgi:toxin FitB